MQPVQTRSSFLHKQIPTFIGVFVLLGALVAGLFMFSEGTGVFAPRATPQTTPKQVKITNVADKAFTISFYTDEATAGFVKYGTTESELSAQASDDRDQLSGTVGKYNLHHISLKGLKPSTKYFFTLGTGSGVVYDNNGSPFSITTSTEVSGPPPVANTIYGTVTNAGGTPAEGGIVYVAIDGVNELSALVKASGSWAISLANARMKDQGGYVNLKGEALLNIFVQGTSLNQTAQTAVALQSAQPVADLALGAGSGAVVVVPTTIPTVASSEASDSSALAQTDATATLSGGLSGLDLQAAGASPTTDQASPGSQLADATVALPTLAAATTDQNTNQTTSPSTNETTATAPTPTVVPTSAITTPDSSTASAVLNLQQAAVGGPVVTSETPKIVGQAPPRIQVKIEVHSDTQITQTVTTTDGGSFELDLAQYQSLEPGEHTVTITYTDPQTGQEVSKTQTFLVEDKRLLAQATTTGNNASVPYGSGNPYPVLSPTVTPTPEPTSVVAATDSSELQDSSTRSAVVSTTSGTYNSGSVGVTFALVGGGLFFILTGLWSWWLAGQVREEVV